MIASEMTLRARSVSDRPVRPADAEVVECDPGLLEAASGLEEQPRAFSGGNADQPCLGIGPRLRLGDVGEQGGGAAGIARVRHACLQRGAAGLGRTRP
jgi:hypothetical protein